MPTEPTAETVRSATPRKKPAAPAKKAAPPAKKAAAPAKKVSAGAKAKPKDGKAKKPKQPKLVRDSFTIPKDEYAALADLKQRSIKLARPAKKSELLRAGIKALAGLNDNALLAALKAVPAVKTGRPKKT